MKKSVGMVAVALVLSVASARAEHAVPQRATKLLAELVNDFGPCSGAPNTQTSLGMDACSPSTNSDILCHLGSSGRGRFMLTVTSTPGGADIKLVAIANGLESCPDGEELIAFADVDMRLDDCAGGDCTTGRDTFELGRCSVRNGRCAIKGTVNALRIGEGSGPIVTGGRHSELRITGCGMRRTGALGRTLACGLLVP